MMVHKTVWPLARFEMALFRLAETVMDVGPVSPSFHFVRQQRRISMGSRTFGDELNVRILTESDLDLASRRFGE